MNHAYSRKIDTRGKWSSLIPIFFGIVAAGLLTLQVIVSNQLANTGSRMNEIESDIEKLTQENTKLREQTASASSLLTIKVKAREMGFTKTIAPVYLSNEIPVALK